MKNSLFKNGFIIKSFRERDYPNKLKNYSGVGRYITWPLEDLSDDISVDLTNEAEERWFGYQDQRLWVVPDFDYLQRYEQHCKDLNISTFCLQIESMNSIVTTSINLTTKEVLGFDYADTDMSTSCLYDDLTMDEDTVKANFKSIMNKLNQYGLAESMEEIQHYLAIRNKLIKAGYDMEEYYCPTIIKLTRVILNRF